MDESRRTFLKSTAAAALVTPFAADAKLILPGNVEEDVKIITDPTQDQITDRPCLDLYFGGQHSRFDVILEYSMRAHTIHGPKGQVVQVSDDPEKFQPFIAIHHQMNWSFRVYVTIWPFDREWINFEYEFHDVARSVHKQGKASFMERHLEVPAGMHRDMIATIEFVDNHW